MDNDDLNNSTPEGYTTNGFNEALDANRNRAINLVDEILEDLFNLSENTTYVKGNFGNVLNIKSEGYADAANGFATFTRESFSPAVDKMQTYEENLQVINDINSGALDPEASGVSLEQLTADNATIKNEITQLAEQQIVAIPTRLPDEPIFDPDDPFYDPVPYVLYGPGPVDPDDPEIYPTEPVVLYGPAPYDPDYPEIYPTEPIELYGPAPIDDPTPDPNFPTRPVLLYGPAPTENPPAPLDYPEIVEKYGVIPVPTNQ